MPLPALPLFVTDAELALLETQARGGGGDAALALAWALRQRDGARARELLPRATEGPRRWLVEAECQALDGQLDAAEALGVEFTFLTPQSFRTFAMPSYRDVRLAMPRPARIAELIAEARPDSIHIATEGPIGLMVRRYCRQRKLPFTTSFHTRFPEYVRARVPVPGSLIWHALRRFHAQSRAVMAATPALAGWLARVEARPSWQLAAEPIRAFLAGIAFNRH